MKFLPIVWLSLLLLLTACRNSQQTGYSFFVAGHTYGNPGRVAPGLHPPFVAEFDKIRSYPGMKFGVFTGDIVYYSRDSFWNAVDSQIHQLAKPVYFAAGNHDKGTKSPYKDRYGETYFAIEQDDDLHIVLNPGLNGWNIQGAQLDFLQSKLEQSQPGHPIFIYFHQVLWWTPDNEYKTYKPNSLDGRAPSINFWETVIPLLQQRPEPVFCFAGDVGAIDFLPSFMKGQKENIHFIASGMGNQKNDNYLLVTVGQDKQVNIKVKWIQKQQVQTVDFD